MGEITRGEIVRVGVDLAKRVIQGHAVDAAGRVVIARPLARDKVAALVRAIAAGLPGSHGSLRWRASLVAQAAGDGPGYAADRGSLRRPLPHAGQVGQERRQRCGRRVRGGLASEHAFRAGQDPAAAASLAVHRLREGYKEERTACVNRIRGLLAEFGLVFAQSSDALRLALPDTLEDASCRRGPGLLCSARSCSGSRSIATSPGATNASPRMSARMRRPRRRPRCAASAQ